VRYKFRELTRPAPFSVANLRWGYTEISNVHWGEIRFIGV
jgi:hypothetical protein